MSFIFQSFAEPSNIPKGLYTVGRTASFLFLQTLALMLVLSVMFYYTRRDISVSPDVPDGHKVGGEQHSFVLGTFFTIVCVTSSSLGSVVGERFLVRDQRGGIVSKMGLTIAHPQYTEGEVLKRND